MSENDDPSLLHIQTFVLILGMFFAGFRPKNSPILPLTHQKYLVHFRPIRAESAGSPALASFLPSPPNSLKKTNF